MNDLSELIADCNALMDAKEPNYGVLARARELADLGFDYLGAKMWDSVLLQEKLEYIKKLGIVVITPAKIQSFLDRKAKEYNEGVVKKHGPTREKKSLLAAMIDQRIQDSQDQMNDFLFSELTGGFSVPGISTSTNTWWRGSEQIGVQTPSLMALTNDFLSPTDERVSGFMWNEVKIEKYKAIPPDNALKALKSAKTKELFHYYTIASVTKMHDPLLLGRLNGTEDRYFLAQWGDDIALDDVI